MGSVAERHLPPIAEITVTSMGFVIVGGIYLASHFPRPASLAIPAALLGVAGVLLLTSVVLLARLKDFAWDTFFLVAKWALLAYAVIAGMLAFVFIFDHTWGASLAILLLSLVVFAVDIPLILAFSVARYQEPAI